MITDREKMMIYMMHIRNQHPEWNQVLLKKHCIEFARYFTPSLASNQAIETLRYDIGISLSEAQDVMQSYLEAMDKEELTSN